jgi:hypothetical protein
VRTFLNAFSGVHFRGTGTARRVTIALAIAAVAAIAALAAGVDSLWHHRSSSRPATDAYIRSIDRVEQQMRLPLTHVLTAYRNFSTQATTPVGRRRLVEATRTLAILQRRVESLDAPPAATKLQQLLVQLVAQERIVGQEVQQLAVFLPRFENVLQQARVAQTTLSHQLAGITVPAPRVVRGNAAAVAKARAEYAATQTRVARRRAAAIEVYDRSIARVYAHMRGLHPPPVMAPDFRTQLKTLRATHAAGVALVAELQSANQSRIPVLSRRLAEAARIAWTVGAQRAEVAAIEAYNKRVRNVGSLQGRVQLEVSRLARSTT